MSFQLIGHECPTGEYPGPVVPIGNLGGRRVALFRTRDAVTFEAIDPGALFVEYPPDLRRSLVSYDVGSEALFAFSEMDVVSYKIEDERTFFDDLLRGSSDANRTIEDPFFRLSLATATGRRDTIFRELVRSTRAIYEESPMFLNDWYRRTLTELEATGLHRDNWPRDPTELLVPVAQMSVSGALSASREQRPQPTGPWLRAGPALNSARETERPVASAQSGDLHRPAMGELLCRNDGRVLKYLIARGATASEAQEIWEAASKQLLSLEDHPRSVSSFDDYLFRTVRNVALNRFRHPAKWQRENLLSSSESTEGLSPELFQIERQRQDLLRRVVQDLPARCRMALVLRIRDSLSYAEIVVRFADQGIEIGESALRGYVRMGLERCRREILAAEGNESKVSTGQEGVSASERRLQEAGRWFEEHEEGDKLSADERQEWDRWMADAANRAEYEEFSLLNARLRDLPVAALPSARR